VKRAVAFLAALLLVSFGSRVRAQTTETNSFTNLDKLIPDGSPSGLHDVRTITSSVLNLSSLRVKLRIIGEFDGDLYGYLRHIRFLAISSKILST
jgi:hypothetical protein